MRTRTICIPPARRARFVFLPYPQQVDELQIQPLGAKRHLWTASVRRSHVQQAVAVDGTAVQRCAWYKVIGYGVQPLAPSALKPSSGVQVLPTVHGAKGCVEFLVHGSTLPTVAQTLMPLLSAAA